MAGHHTPLLLILLITPQVSQCQVQQINCSLPIEPSYATAEGEVCKNYDTDDGKKCKNTNFMNTSELAGLVDDYFKLTIKNASAFLWTNETVIRVRVWPAGQTGGKECTTQAGEVVHASMNKTATFVIKKHAYENGLCLMTELQQVTERNQLWKPAGPKVDQTCEKLTAEDKIIITLEGNGSDYLLAHGLFFGGYAIFSVVFLLAWYFLVFPGSLWKKISTTCKFKWARRVRVRLARGLITYNSRPVTARRIVHVNQDGDTVTDQFRSQMSWKMLLTTSVLYLIPSLQYTLSESLKFRLDGNQDHCFYNFKCLKPQNVLGITFIPYNHLMSNIGYGILGALFLLAVVIKERSQLRKRIEEEGEPEATEAVSKGWVSLSDLRKHGETSEQQTGTRIGYQLFYTMGITLIMIGFMSSCYHLCPTDVNFQFDTTYMYLLAILMAINLFKGRHPDLSPDVIAAFTILSFIVTVGVISVYMEEWLPHLKAVFVFIYLWTLITFASVWYMLDMSNPNCWIQKGKWSVFYKVAVEVPRHIFKNYKTPLKSPTRLFFICIFLVVNFGLIVLVFKARELPSAFLAIFLANFFLYLKFYVFMKFYVGEWPTNSCWIFLLLTILCAVPALYHFVASVKDTSVLAHRSRMENKDCYPHLNYFDAHDVWHFIGSFGLFFTLMFLLNIDDDIADWDQANIQVW